jgi:hypothetical protein
VCKPTCYIQRMIPSPLPPPARRRFRAVSLRPELGRGVQETACGGGSGMGSGATCFGESERVCWRGGLQRVHWRGGLGSGRPGLLEHHVFTKPGTVLRAPLWMEQAVLRLVQCSLYYTVTCSTNTNAQYTSTVLTILTCHRMHLHGMLYDLAGGSKSCTSTTRLTTAQNLKSRWAATT